MCGESAPSSLGGDGGTVHTLWFPEGMGGALGLIDIGGSKWYTRSGTWGGCVLLALPPPGGCSTSAGSMRFSAGKRVVSTSCRGRKTGGSQMADGQDANVQPQVVVAVPSHPLQSLPACLPAVLLHAWSTEQRPGSSLARAAPTAPQPGPALAHAHLLGLQRCRRQPGSDAVRGLIRL